MMEKIAEMMIRCSLATGHGDTVEDLLAELEEQIKELQAERDLHSADAKIAWGQCEGLRAELAQARKAALEEAARCIEEDYHRAANAIRALKGEPK